MQGRQRFLQIRRLGQSAATTTVSAPATGYALGTPARNGADRRPAALNYDSAGEPRIGIPPYKKRTVACIHNQTIFNRYRIRCLPHLANGRFPACLPRTTLRITDADRIGAIGSFSNGTQLDEKVT